MLIQFRHTEGDICIISQLTPHEKCSCVHYFCPMTVFVSHRQSSRRLYLRRLLKWKRQCINIDIRIPYHATDKFISKPPKFNIYIRHTIHSLNNNNTQNAQILLKLFQQISVSYFYFFFFSLLCHLNNHRGEENTKQRRSLRNMIQIIT